MESVEPFVAEQLAAWEVPGCAVAAVRGGRVELVGGWGRRDREAGLPVTQDTLFAIGSTTKAFTATTVGALVDEGLLEWDRPLRDYVPGVRLDENTLKPSLGTMHLSLVHRHYETFDLTWHEVGDQPVVFPLTFLSDPDGDLNALTVRFEPAVDALRFDKRPDPTGPGILGRLCGTYAMGPIELAVALRGERTLTVTAPGTPPFDLEPISGLRFSVKDQPAITAEFELDDNGAVSRLIAQPLGIFLADRCLT